MAKDIAALSGGDKTAFKAALGGMGYMVPISSVAISSPVEYQDIVLPAGYSRFLLFGDEIEFSPADNFSFVLGSGASFWADATDYDTYGLLSSGVAPDSPNTAQLLQTYNPLWDGQSDNTPNHTLHDVMFTIMPGNVTRTPRVQADIMAWTTTDFSTAVWRKTLWFLNPTAVTPPTFARANKIRILPNGNDDNPPTSGNTIIGGQFALFGIPSA